MKTKSTWIDGVDDAKLHHLLSERAATHRSGAALRADTTRAPGFVFLRPPCRGVDCPEWPPEDMPPDDPCRGQTWVWQPTLPHG